MAEDLEGIIEIQDTAIDLDALLNRVRDNVDRRRAQIDGLIFEGLARGIPARAEGRRLSDELYFNLIKAEISQQQLNVAPDYRPTSASMLGRLWYQIRRQTHGLVLFYVNKGVARQMVFNTYMLLALQQLVDQVERSMQAADLSEMAQLREELAQLEQRVASLS